MVEQADTKDRYKLNIKCFDDHVRKSRGRKPILFHEVGLGNHKQWQIATIAGGIRNRPRDRLPYS